ncbi:MAG: hypothetical protein Q8859_13290, partial [Bacteroidota bacterium]|nr:hypothetical protein [Bacteroidota bacterium]
MKKIFLILLSCMIYTATYSKDNLNNESGTDKSGGERITINHSSKNINGITLFVNQVNTFTTEDWKALAESKITDFVIIPLSAKKYGSTESGYKTQLAPIIINTINQLIKY